VGVGSIISEPTLKAVKEVTDLRDSGRLFHNFYFQNHCTVTKVKQGFSGGNSLFPVGGRSLLNFRQNFQISDNPPPPFALEKAVFSSLIGQNFRKFVIFHEGGISATAGFILIKI
jgi:hypothetical protein